MKKVLKVMDSSGDSQFAFDSDIKNTERSEAQRFFDKLTAQKVPIFAIESNNEARRVNHFDDLGQENVAVPRLMGG